MSNDPRLNPLEVYLGKKHLNEKSSTFLILGIILVLLGILAIFGANYATLTSIIFFGILLAIGGVLQIIYAFWGREGHGFAQTLLSGLLYAIVGLVFITHPTASAVALTLLLAVFYTVSGIFKIVMSLTHRIAQWGWLLFSGIVSLGLGLLIWAEWPTIGLWLIGLFIGIDLIFVGWFWVMLGIMAKKLSQKP